MFNHHLYYCCIAEKITFTRGRPGNKNDGSHVEPKNGTTCVAGRNPKRRIYEGQRTRLRGGFE